MQSSENCTVDVTRKVKEKYLEASTDNGNVSVLAAGTHLNNRMHLQLACERNDCEIKIVLSSVYFCVKPVLFLKQEHLFLAYLKLFSKQHKSGQIEGLWREEHSCNPFM